LSYFAQAQLQKLKYRSRPLSGDMISQISRRKNGSTNFGSAFWIAIRSQKPEKDHWAEMSPAIRRASD